MKLLVTGGRDFADWDFVYATLDALHARTRITLVIHGGCRDDADSPSGIYGGADAIADAWARARGVPVQPMPARWRALGFKAGPIRNSKMVAEGPDRVLAFPGDRGTNDTKTKARRKGIPIIEASPTSGIIGV
jgi:hypothetical protein